ncbi:MAG: PfkB family carbohydrate kinase [Chloroflexia bacterium]
MERKPDYLVIGHVSKDLLPGGMGARAGGTASYSSITAQRLGLQAAIVTALAPEDEGLLDEAREAGVWVCAIPSGGTTTFENVYDSQGRRTQRIGSPAGTIEWSDVPTEWRGASIVHLGPVAQELPPDMPARFAYSLLGITPQGWMRSWDAEGRVGQAAWPIPKALVGLPANACLVLSMEDLGWDGEALAQYSELARIVVITQSAGEALVFVPATEVMDYVPKESLDARWRAKMGGKAEIGIPACEALPVDPTGAGDVFATAFLIRYYETHDPIMAGRFAHAAAACAIEGEGTEGIPGRERLLGRV